MAHAELVVRKECHDPEPGLVSQSLEEAGNGSNVERDGHIEIRISECPEFRKPIITIGGPKVLLPVL
jgi:hypothetical protein